ncbi:hypothetical protein DM01DRAFT_265311 [Hesseltinella vesiculosa]|uniref:Inorganic phosphate transport PHO88 n=1 Tax=Hesseltinella vesiculosa TaxID=101127 RepID=A0A1X2G2F5_9FUNG|nr:hypothetical protein DM01DRAFT_265311 [Hesseltinella vesiculosa]
MPSLTRIVNNPFFNIAFFFAVRQAIKYFGLEKPEYLMGFRILYYGVQILVVLLSFYIISIINTKNDQTVLRYVDPAKPGWDGVETQDTLVVTTFAGKSLIEYDKQEVFKAMKQSAMGIAMVSFLHFKFGYIQPLVIQSLLGIKAFFTTKEARIHLFHESTKSGDLKRPFSVQAPLGMNQMFPQPKTDKASIKKAERALKAD